MLTDHDIQHIKENRKQITKHRLTDVLLYKRTEGPVDPFTGDPTFEDTEEAAKGTWTSLISQSGGEGEIQFDNGVHVVTDDVIFNLDIEYDVEGLSEVTHVETGDTYAVKAIDQKGIGAANRHYILLELVK